jgi:hypothetical protein
MVLAIIGGFGFFATQAAQNECSSALVSAFYSSQCNEVNAIHIFGLIGLVGGIALFAFGIYRHNSSN